MKIKMNTTYAGPDGAAHPGQIIDVPPERARALCDKKFAEAVDPFPALPKAPQSLSPVLPLEPAPEGRMGDSADAGETDDPTTSEPGTAEEEPAEARASEEMPVTPTTRRRK